jgi:hypothetical protein
VFAVPGPDNFIEVTSRFVPCLMGFWEAVFILMAWHNFRGVDSLMKTQT